MLSESFSILTAYMRSYYFAHTFHGDRIFINTMVLEQPITLAGMQGQHLAFRIDH